MEQQTLEIEKPEHGERELFWFPNPPTLAPFNWRHLLMKLSRDERDEVVGSGVVTVGLYTTPGSYSHQLCNRKSKNTTLLMEGKLVQIRLLRSSRMLPRWPH